MIIRMMIVEWNYAPPERQNGHIVSDADKDYSMHGITHQLWGGGKIEGRKGQWCMWGSQFGITHQLRGENANIRSALHARLTIWNYTQPERAKCTQTRSALHFRWGSQYAITHKLRGEEKVSIVCQAHNTEIRTRWDGKLDKDEVSFACEAHNKELHTWNWTKTRSALHVQPTIMELHTGWEVKMDNDEVSSNTRFTMWNYAQSKRWRWRQGQYFQAYNIELHTNYEAKME